MKNINLWFKKEFKILHCFYINLDFLQFQFLSAKIYILQIYLGKPQKKFFFFLVVRPLRGGLGLGKGPTTKEKRTFFIIYLYILAQNSSKTTKSGGGEALVVGLLNKEPFFLRLPLLNIKKFTLKNKKFWYLW